MNFKDFRDKHKGSRALVLGCGESALRYGEVKTDGPGIPPLITVGVNDIQRLMTPDYLLVVNAKSSFKADRWDWITNTKAKAVFTHMETLEVPPQKRVTFRLGKTKWVDLDRIGGGFVDYSNNSPYMAVILAYYLGATRIGILGVDFTPNHFFEKSGEHQLTKRLKDIRDEYRRLREALEEKNVELFNLNERTSQLNSVLWCEPKDF